MMFDAMSYEPRGDLKLETIGWARSFVGEEQAARPVLTRDEVESSIEQGPVAHNESWKVIGC